MKNLNELLNKKATKEMIKLAKAAKARDFANKNIDITFSFEAMIEANENPAKDKLTDLLIDADLPVIIDTIELLADM